MKHSLRVLVRVGSRPGPVRLEVEGCLTAANVSDLIRIIDYGARLDGCGRLWVDLLHLDHMELPGVAALKDHARCLAANPHSPRIDIVAPTMPRPCEATAVCARPRRGTVSPTAAVTPTAPPLATPRGPRASGATGHGPKRIVVFGGAGAIGHHLTTEAASRGHHLTVVSRSPGPLPHLAHTQVQGDMAEPTVVEHLARQADVVVCAIGPDPSAGGARTFRRVVKTATDHLVGARLIVIGCAGTLLRPDGRALNGHRHTRDHAEVLHDLHLTPADVNWTCLTPPPVLTTHPRTGLYITGTHTLAGASVSIADLAVALVDEIEHPTHPRNRFTVAAHPTTNSRLARSRGLTTYQSESPRPCAH